jgi:hypothetical protein
MSFIVYDKEGNLHKICHAIDVKTAIRGGCFTMEPPELEPEVEIPKPIKKVYGRKPKAEKE